MKKELFIIDDDPVYRMIISKMATYIDADVTIHHCEDGEKGLQRLQSLENSDHVSVVLLDINMPRLNGWGVLKELENHGFESGHHPSIYVVSSSTDESDMAKSKTFKLTKGFYIKPLSVDDIKSILNECDDIKAGDH